MEARAWLSPARARTCALVCTSFLLGSTGWLAWLYHLASLANPNLVDLYTMVLGYLAQGVGLGVYALMTNRASPKAREVGTMVALGAYVLLLEPAVTADTLASTLFFGYAMNILCGYYQGHYLAVLAGFVGSNARGTVFGTGYAASTLLSWILSAAGGGSLTTGPLCTLVCVLLGLAAMFLVRSVAAAEPDQERDGAPAPSPTEVAANAPTRQTLLVAGAAVVVVSLVKNAGFSFPTSDLSGVVNLELSRLFYGVGLVTAGILADRDRRFALVCCTISLVMPFLMLALEGAGNPSVVLWALGYLFYGFFSVWRIVLFADLAASTERPWLACLGLLLGRAGDAAGTALCVGLDDSKLALVVVTFALFVVAAGLLFVLYERQYAVRPVQVVEPNKPDLMQEFCKRYSLSNREQEVLFFIVDGLSNVKITKELCISEATVKFHVRNILRKTGCANRIEVLKLYKGMDPTHNQ